MTPEPPQVPQLGSRAMTASPSRSERPNLSAADSQTAALQSEIDRLRRLVGPTEESYEKLRLDVLGARDVALSAEAELGRLRGEVIRLTTHAARLERDHVWFREQVLRRISELRSRVLSLRKVLDRLIHR